MRFFYLVSVLSAVDDHHLLCGEAAHSTDREGEPCTAKQDR